MNTEKRKKSKHFPLAVTLLLIIITVQILNSCTTADAEGETNGEPVKIQFQKPDSHKADWLRYHGEFTELNWNRSEQKGSSCYICHEKRECLQCHNTMLPQNHRNTWRTLGHGLAAAADRASCLSCHRQDYCIRCHNETAPRSHKANWIGNHCGQCHYDLVTAYDISCVTCHKRILHRSAPHVVNTQSDCLNCH